MPTHFRGSAKQTAALNAYIKLMRCSASVSQRVHARLQQFGLTQSQFGVLEALYHLGPMCQKELGEKLIQSGGNITMVVNNLEKHGLVIRLRDEVDKRYILVHLTWRGTEMIKEIFPQHVEDIQGCFEVLSAEELSQLEDLLRKVGKG
jgi:MarR family transcriptional regulator, 2-MHQ and catechol-resistance regulon repressor